MSRLFCVCRVADGFIDGLKSDLRFGFIECLVGNGCKGCFDGLKSDLRLGFIVCSAVGCFDVLKSDLRLVRLMERSTSIQNHISM